MTPAGKQQLRSDEGLGLVAYPDPLSPLAKTLRQRGWRPTDYARIEGWRGISGAPWTNGYGNTHGVTPGQAITVGQAETQLDANIAEVSMALAHNLPWFAALDPVRADVLINIAFNVGTPTLLTWHDTLAKFEAADWAGAAAELRSEGLWNEEVGARAERLADATEHGYWGDAPAAPDAPPAPANDTDHAE